MPSGEFAARTRFEVALESGGFLFASEGDGRFHMPRFVFGGVADPAVVVRGKARTQVCGRSNVVPRRSGFAHENVNVVEHAGDVLPAIGWLAKP